MAESGENVWAELREGLRPLAPMEGVTDVVFRQVVAKAGYSDLFFTEFTNVSELCVGEGATKCIERLEVALTDARIIAQIGAKNPEHFAELAGALEGLGFAGLDINMGRPGSARECGGRRSGNDPDAGAGGGGSAAGAGSDGAAGVSEDAVGLYYTEEFSESGYGASWGEAGGG